MSHWILTDVDDCCLLFADAMQAFLATKGYRIPVRMRDFHDIPALFDLTTKETLQLIREFHRSPLMGQLEPEPCAAAVLPALHKKGYRFVAVTACLDEPEVFAMRKRNLEQAFGFRWDAIHCVGLGRDKDATLNAYPEANWVEDIWHHAVSGAKLGHRTFILDRPYNRGYHHSGVTRAADWHEIADHIEKATWQARWEHRTAFI